MSRRLSLAVCILAALFFSSACGHYQLGTSGQLAFTTLYIAPVKMRALVPQAQPILGTQIRDAFLRDGRVTLLNSAGDADATLQIEIRDYQRSVATVRPGDTGLARKFIVTLSAVATLTDHRSGQVLFADRPITVQRDVFTDSGQQQSEYQMLPLLAQDLAAKASHAVLDTW